MKAGVVAETYKFDRNLENLLNGFAGVLYRRPGLKYIGEYMEYLNRRGENQERLLEFYHYVGYELMASELKNYPIAIKYLNYGIYWIQPTMMC